jgi:hypothetical protein
MHIQNSPDIMVSLKGLLLEGKSVKIIMEMGYSDFSAVTPVASCQVS